MNDRSQTVIAVLKRQGRGRIRISDIRKAAGLRDTGGDQIAQRLIKEGSLRRVAWDHYELTDKESVMPEPKRKMRASAIEAEILRRIADHPDCGNVSGVGIHATDAAAPTPNWAVGGVMYRGSRHAAMPRISEVVSELQREIDLSD